MEEEDMKFDEKWKENIREKLEKTRDSIQDKMDDARDSIKRKQQAHHDKKELERRQQEANEKDFNDVLNSFKDYSTPHNNFYFNNDSDQILLVKSFDNYEYTKYDITDFSGFSKDVQQGTYTETKKKHGITRSVVGGVIAGPVGALIGAGTSKGNTTQNTYISGVDFTIRFRDGYTCVLGFDGTEGGISASNSFEILLEEIKNSQNQGNQKQNSSSVDDLTKLKELVDAGVLTEEEFTAKKKQILGI